MLLTRRHFIKLGLIASVSPRSLLASRDDAWSFAAFSDTHWGVAGNAEKNLAMLQQIVAHGPEFAVDIGDVTERAWPEEFDAATHALSALPFKTYAAPGNHDVRWAARGLTMFTERMGPPHQLFTHNGCAFLLIDSTVPLSHWGHIGGPQRRWIDEQLKTIDRKTPLFAFMHHWAGRPNAIDDELVLLEALAPYNIKVVFTGHGHSDLLWSWNGIPTTMGKGLYQGSYQLAQVDTAAGEMKLLRGKLGSSDLTPITSVSLAPPPTQIAVPARVVEGEAKGPITKAWQQPLGGGVLSHLLLHDDTLYVSAMDGGVYSFDANSGKPKWRAMTGGYCFSSPVVADKLVIVGSADGNVYAFDRANGAERWKVATGGPVYGSAAVAKGVAAIASGDGVLYGIDLKAGKVRWRYALQPGPSAFSQSPAATDGERIIFGAWDQFVYAVDAATGKEAWKYRATERGFYFSAAIAKPAIADGRVFVPANENVLHALDAKTGNLIWKHSAKADHFGYSSPTVVQDRIYIGALGDKGEVYCLNAETGADIWTAATGATIYESSPAVSGDIVAIGSVNGTLSVMRAGDGNIIGSYKFPPGLFIASPAVQKRRVYAATFAEQVAAFDVAV